MGIPREYIMAGRITREGREWVRGRVVPGSEYLDICEKLEGEIVQRGGRVGFPPGVGGNSVTAHYAPQAGGGGRAGKSIPNVYMPNLPTLKKNEVFAVEPFLTTREADGYVVDSEVETIFALVGRRRLGKGELDDLVEMIWEERKTLPFTPRWFLKDYREARLLSLLKELTKRKVVRSYATLVEASGKPVAQFEHTMALDEEEGLIILT